MLSQFWENPDFWNIFPLALLIAVAKVAAKYITKLGSRGAAGYTRADHFDCLRFGVDFVFIGIASGLSAWHVLLKQSQNPSKSVSTLGPLSASGGLYFAAEFALFALTLLFAAVFHDWAKSYYRGILVPGMFGLLSLLLSVTFFVSLVQ